MGSRHCSTSQDKAGCKFLSLVFELVVNIACVCLIFFCSDALQQSLRCVRRSINACVCWWGDHIAWIVHVWESVVTFYDLVCLVSNVRFLFCSFWHTQMPDIQEWTDICGQMHGAGAAAGRSPHGLTWRDLLFCYAPFLKGHKSALTKCDSEARCTTAACTCHAHPP